MTELAFPAGAVLSGVAYELLSWESPPEHGAPVDEVAMAITLHWGTAAPTRVSWSTDPEREGLVAGGPSWAPYPDVRTVDVSARWGRLVGQPVTGLGFTHAEPFSDLPWAANLEFGTGRHLVIALGELLDDEPAYIPDSLIITGSRDVAMAYKPPASAGTAWGEESGGLGVGG
jgi:hypothetical protein